MSINGGDAVIYLATITARVAQFKKDKTDKFWSYKLKSANHTEFAFDPNTTTGLFVRVDRELPALPGISNIEQISGKNVSTALERVFSGGVHKANFLATIENQAALESFILYYEEL